MPVSLAPKPVPVIVIEVPGAAFIRLEEMFGVTVKVRSGTLAAAVEAPLASMVCEPEAEAGITKLALQLPLTSAEGDTGTVTTAAPS